MPGKTLRVEIQSSTSSHSLGSTYACPAPLISLADTQSAEAIVLRLVCAHELSGECGELTDPPTAGHRAATNDRPGCPRPQVA